jgi:predicted ATPase
MSTAQHLDDLERRSLIALAAATPDLAYIFRHVLAQDAVYASLVRRQRGAIHGLVGDVLENLYARPTASPQLAALLGRHFGEAGDGARALPYLVQAGDHALSQYANHEAADYYDSRARPAWPTCTKRAGRHWSAAAPMPKPWRVTKRWKRRPPATKHSCSRP